MRISDFNKPITAEQLNESAAKLFNARLNIDEFTTEQLLDARNRVRTVLSQFDLSENFAAGSSPEYAKNKMFLDIINKVLEERDSSVVEFTDMEKMVMDKVNEGLIDFSELPVALQEKASRIAEQQSSVAGTVLTEGEEERAELIMSARDMVDRITGWMEDTANMQAEAMLELVDSIRDELGSDISVEFESVVKPALASIYTTLEAARTQLTRGVEVLTGEGDDDMLGADPAVADPNEILPPEDGSEEAATGDTTDEFAADAAANGGSAPEGRETRESVEFAKKK